MGGSCSNCFSRFSFRRQAGGIEHGFNIPNVYQVEDEEEECAKTPSWLSFIDQEGAEGDNVFVDERCFICLEDYNEQQNLPRILPCGHIVCNKCLIELGRSTVFTKIKCPQDRHSFKIKKRHMPGNLIYIMLFISIVLHSKHSRPFYKLGLNNNNDIDI